MALGNHGRYIAEGFLGDGTFGRVLSCRDSKTDGAVAVKIVKGVKRFRENAEDEADVLAEILRKDVKCEGRCVRMLDTFLHDSQNFCIVLEPLDTSLRDFLKANNSRGLPMADVSEISRQLLQSLAFLHSIQLVHTDLKCRNVMLRHGACDAMPFARGGAEASTKKLRAVDIVLIDFGSACFPEDRHDGRVGTRQFRSPELVLGLPWDESADMWAAGCIIGMLYLGSRVFSVHEDMEHLAIMEKVLGLPVPPRLLLDAKAAGVVPEGVAATANGMLLWPSHAPDEGGVDRVRRLSPLRQHVLERHTPFFDLCAGLLDMDPKLRLSASSALEAPLFVGPPLPE